MVAKKEDLGAVLGGGSHRFKEKSKKNPVKLLEGCTLSLDSAKVNGLPSDERNSNLSSNSLGENSVATNQI
ncbi:hypothetical protein RJT34_01829 [Clitoria ternatea]|uniref:Uncharacterized protein n=1 Tax=Clitoria ternatea TaxID=43366 RepID=A0AAN9KJS7_CLITE